MLVWTITATYSSSITNAARFQCHYMCGFVAGALWLEAVGFGVVVAGVLGLEAVVFELVVVGLGRATVGVAPIMVASLGLVLAVTVASSVFVDSALSSALVISATLA